MHDSIDDQTRNERSIGIGTDDGFIHDLLCDNDHLASRKGYLFLHSQQTPELCVALTISPLCMENRDIGMEWRHDCHLFTLIRTLYKFDLIIDKRHFGTQIAAQRIERQAGGSGNVASDQTI